jgi:hypothetical protein
MAHAHIPTPAIATRMSHVRSRDRGTPIVPTLDCRDRGFADETPATRKALLPAEIMPQFPEPTRAAGFSAAGRAGAGA